MNELLAAPTPAGTIRNFIGSGMPGTDTAADANEPANRLQSALRKMPKAGEEFVGFRLVRELGRGAFGRVFLATQSELAGRSVALKVSADLTGESRTLAQLQHTNIVPVYSVHQDGLLQAVCMPYFGSTTLADLIRRWRSDSSLPATGLDLVNTLRGMTVITRPDSRREGSRDGDGSGSVAQKLSPDPRTDAVFAVLSKMSYSEAVCWLVSRVADGLAHAHERGILHRDVKPANILVTDDGQPMLLDFGVSEDLTVRATAVGGRVGGTIPYMAPEHLEEVRSEDRLLDHRSDIYSLGVILFELLTGRHPFRVPQGDLTDELPALIADRRAWVPDLRDANFGVPADLEAVVRKCVAADPKDRYQSAADLREDLERHLRNEPLKVAQDPTLEVRFQKWRKRHPRFVAQAFVTAGVLAGLGLSVGAIVAWKRFEAAKADEARLDQQRARELAGLHADRQFQAFQQELRHGQYLLSGQTHAPAVRTGVDKVRAALDLYAVADDAGWEARPEFAALPDDRKSEARRLLADACLFLARGQMQLAGGHRDRLTVAARFNALSETLRDGPTPRAVLSQRAELLGKLSDKAVADEADKRAKDTPLRSAEDYYLSANELVGQGKSADAIPLFKKALWHDPKHFWAHFGLGIAYHNTGRTSDARASYATAVALRPDFAWSYYNRALAGITLRQYDEAVSDLDTVVELRPEYLPAVLHRAQAHEGAGDRQAALKDLAAVLRADDTEGMHGRAYLLRSKYRRADGDAAGAKADLEAGLKFTPVDDTGWLIRGYARLDTDPVAALADFDAALKLSPNSIQALQNKAHVLDNLKRNDECLVVLDRLVELVPKQMMYRAGRAVVLARLGRLDDAVAAAKEALAKDDTSFVKYQAACVYSLASGRKPEYREEAIRTLTRLLNDGLDAKMIRDDKDFDAIRDDAGLKKWIESAK